jgi:DNA-binding IclR family transcriptional regulator
MIQSVDRALLILTAVSSCGTWVGVRDIARQVGLKVPTVQNLLKTLAAKGFLDFNEETRRYRLGLAVYRLADNIGPVAWIGEFARPYIDRVFTAFGETATICTMVSDRVVVVDSRVSDSPLTVIHPRRVVENPHCLASGKMLLSGKDEEFIRRYAANQPLSKLGPNTPSTAKALLTELAQVRKQGYAEAVDSQGHGVGAVAVPVRDAAGRTAMTIACSAPLSRFAAARRKEVRALLLAVAKEMEARIGGEKQ